MRSSAATEVLRGMHVESAPLHLARARPASAPAAATDHPEPAEDDAFEDTRRRALDEAARLGREEGLRTGYEAGMRKGLADAAGQVQAAVQKAKAEAGVELDAQRRRLHALAGELQAVLHDVLAAAEDEMVALCFDTLCRMSASAALDEDSVRAQLLALAGQVRPGELLAMHVHPGDLAFLCAPPAGASGIAWVGDPEVRIGGCVLRRKGGGLDARLETMLDACKAAMLAARAQRAREAEGGR